MFEIFAVGVGVAAAIFALVRFTPLWLVISPSAAVSAATANDAGADDGHA